LTPTGAQHCKRVAPGLLWQRRLLEPVHANAHAGCRLVWLARAFSAHEVGISFKHEAVPAPTRPQASPEA